MTPAHPSPAASPGFARAAVASAPAGGFVYWQPIAVRGWSETVWMLALAAHPLLAMAMKASPLVAKAHMAITLAAALWAIERRAGERLLYLMGYIVASEGLWRANRGLIFHETAKYALAGLCLLAILRFRRLRRADKIAALYFLLLVPSIFVVPGFDRRELSFNLSGPFSLALATMFLSTCRIPARALKQILLAVLAPIFGLVVQGLLGALEAETIQYQSSKIASGGLGQNQASSLFGLGALLAFFFVFLEKRRVRLRWLVGVAGIACAAQASLTFSRGGLATAVGALLAASFFLLRDRRSRGMLILRTAFVVVLAAWVVIPVLDDFTHGALSQRFTSTDLTGRDQLIEADLQAFRDHPILGVGPGKSREYHRRVFLRAAAAHTEYSRVLAEHGSFGILALLALAVMSLRRLHGPAPLTAKALVAAFTVWAGLFMFHAAMRMAAASFLFGLGAAALLTVEPGRWVRYPGAARHGPSRRA